MKRLDKFSFSHNKDERTGPGRVIVVGKSGFVGQEVLNLLQMGGIEALGLGREDVNLTSPLAKVFLSTVIRDHDTVVFAAADVPVKELSQFENNLQMLRNFLEGINGIRLSQLMYVSSDAVFTDSTAPLTEESLRGPENLHGLMHLVREVALQNSIHSDILCIARPTIIYGFKDPHNSYGPCSFMRLAQNFEPIVLFGDGEEQRDFIHISDVGKIIFELILHRSFGELNLSTGEVHSFSEVANLVREITASNAEIKSKSRLGPMPHNGYRPFQIDNLRLAFPNLKMKSLKEGLISMKDGY